MYRRDMLKGLSGLIVGGCAPGLIAPTAEAQAQPGRWIKLESDNFIAYATLHEEKAREEVAALEAFHGLLALLSPPRKAHSGPKLNIYFAGADSDMDQAWPGVDDMIGGFYSARIEELRAVVGVSRGAANRDASPKGPAKFADARMILYHEYVHHFQSSAGGPVYPKWYVEGFAEYLMTAEFQAEGCIIGKYSGDRSQSLSGPGWLSIEKLLTGKDLKDYDIGLYYAQAWLMTHMIMSNPDLAEGFDRYVAALSANGDLLASFQPAFGVSLSEFDKRLRAYKSAKLAIRRVSSVKIDANTPIAVTRLGRAADNLLLPLTAVRASQAEDGAPTLSRIRMRADTFRDDPFAQMTLATAEVWLGDPNVARPLIDGLLAASPQDADLRHLSGLCELRIGYRTKDAARILGSANAFAAAVRIDRNRASSLFRYAEAKAQGPAGIDKDVVNILGQAWRLAPQVSSISLMLAQGLIRTRRHDDAVMVLRPLASSAHGGDDAVAAAKLLDVAQAKGELDKIVLYDSAADQKS